LVVTALPVKVNVPVLAPAAIVTVAGTLPFALLTERLTTNPPEGAAEPMVTVPVDVPSTDDPPTTEVGLIDRPVRTGGLIVKDAVGAPFPVPAVTVAVVAVPTGVVVTVKVPVVAPAATVAVAGTVPEGLLELRAMAMPPLGAGPLIVTVPVELVPPVTVVGVSVSPVAVGARTFSVALFELPVTVPVITALLLVDCGMDVTVNVAVV